MKKIPLALAFLIVCALAAMAQQATPAPSPSASPAPKPAMTRAMSQKLIIGTEKKLWESWKTGNFKFFRSTLSADSIMVGESGVADKTASLKNLEDEKCEVKSYELSDIKVTFLNNDAALITYKAAQDGTCGGQAIPPAVWATSAYVKRNGKWFAASHQETVAK
jgi:hypothetical protein